MKKPSSVPSARPRRGSPAETRARLVRAAAEQFNENGLHGTDASGIAAAAGYANGTFYKHFGDKREALMAAYETWVENEWEAIGRQVRPGADPHETAKKVVAIGYRHHASWQGLRSAVAALVSVDSGARRTYRKLQRRQLGTVEVLRERLGHRGRALRESDAIRMMTLESVFDSIANGEPRALGLSRRKMLDQLIDMLAAALKED